MVLGLRAPSDAEGRQLKSPSERTSEWRAALIAKGYKQKAFLLSPKALKALASARKHFASEADTVEAGLADLARSLSPTGKGKR